MAIEPNAPLAARMRPKSLDEIVGQPRLLGPDGPLARLIASGSVPSLLFWGPPGCGKTTLARVIASELKRPLRALNAVQSGVKEVRAALEEARMSPGLLLFIDEIHRLNKAQQDALLAAVEAGTVTLLGATTENPSFEVIPALLSRCQVYTLEALSPEELRELAARALERDEALKNLKFAAWDALYRLSAGDARKALNLLELAAARQTDSPVDDAELTRLAQQALGRYDKGGEQHYDVISAFIKSVRGGDPNAAVYWLARMLHGGEDVAFIARRLVILASEDVGNANPNALLLANACFEAVTRIGMPEARIPLAQTTTYLATSPKSNAAYVAINEAMAFVRQDGAPPVPLHLRNAPTKLMKELDYGKNYKYSHDYGDYAGRDGNQQYMPAGAEGQSFYRPKNAGKERDLRKFMAEKWGGQYEI